MTARETKAHGLMRIVRHREALDFQVAEAETRAGFENLPIGPVREVYLNRTRGSRVGKDPDA